VLTPRRLAPLLFAAILSTLGCRAQNTPVTKIAPGETLPPSVTHRIEVLLRQKAQLPPLATVNVSAVTPSDVPGYSTVNVTFSAEGKTSHPVVFLLSNDGKTIAQFTKYDISADPRLLVSPVGRPGRGGPDSAPVVIVNFDDLECPYCARLHKTIFPAITQRYGDKVHIVYKDFPLEQHPWAMRAAVDVNCLAAQSPAGYWALVDHIHDNASDIGLDHTPKTDTTTKPDPNANKPEHTLERADAELDKLTRDEGAAQKVDATKLNACLAKQDTSAIEASKQLGTTLNIDSTPTMFINGDKIEGALPIGYIFGLIDDALRAENVTPPPPYVDPGATPAAAPNAKPTPAPAAKPAPGK
jgi:protein-disulfide isomerase